MCAQSTVCDTPRTTLYNPEGHAIAVVDAGFAPVNVPMIAHYVWVDTDSSAPKPEHITLRVIGALTRHRVDGYGEIVDTETVLAVQAEVGSETIIPASQHLMDSPSAAFVGCFPEKNPPSQQELARAAVNAWRFAQKAAAQDSKTAKAAA